MVTPLRAVSLRLQREQATVLQLAPEMGHSDVIKEERAGWRLTVSGGKSAMTRRGWLSGLLPAKREKLVGEIASVTRSANFFFFFFNFLFDAKDLRMLLRLSPVNK